MAKGVKDAHGDGQPRMAPPTPSSTRSYGGSGNGKKTKAASSIAQAMKKATSPTLAQEAPQRLIRQADDQEHLQRQGQDALVEQVSRAAVQGSPPVLILFP